MKTLNNDHSGEERLHDALSRISIQPDDQFAEALWERLSERHARQQQTGDRSTMDLKNQKQRRRLAVALGGFALLASLAMTMPQVRAMFGQFVITIGGVGSATIASEITPVYPANIPDRFNNFSMVGGAEGTNALELRYFNASEFIIMTERLLDEDTPATLPEGEPAQVGPHEATIQRNLSGEVRLTAGDPQGGEWAVGFGGGGGGGSGPVEMPPDVLPFSNGIRVAWHQDGLLIEAISNLPEEELLAILSGSTPAEQVSEPDGAISIAMEDGAPGSGGGGGGGSSDMGFEPFTLGYRPDNMQIGGVVATNVDGETLVENHEYGSDNFIVITQTAATPDGELPAGETITLDGGYPATLETGLSGTAYLAGHLLVDGTKIGEPFPYPPGGEPPGYRESADYTDGIRLTWLRDGVWLVLLTDLPLDEAIRVAEGLVPSTIP